MNGAAEFAAAWCGLSVGIAGTFAALNAIGRRRAERRSHRCHGCGRPIVPGGVFCPLCIATADAVDVALAPDVLADLIPVAARPVPPAARRRALRNTNNSKGEGA